MAMKRYDRENVLLDDFTPMLTPESNADVTSLRSNNLSTSNHVSLDSRHWSPSSGGLRFDTLIFASMMFVASNVHATGVVTSINNVGVANAPSLYGHTLEADVVGVVRLNAIFGMQYNKRIPLQHLISEGFDTPRDGFGKYKLVLVVNNLVLLPFISTAYILYTVNIDTRQGNPQQKEYKEKGVIDSGCSRHMTGNKCYLTEYEDYDGGFVSFGDGKGRISGKGTETHKASCKAKLVNSISKPLHMLHMDLFGPTNVKSLMKKSYCLVVTDDFSRFSWVFFLATKDETSGILKTFITEIENQLDHKVKVIRCDNGTEFKNSVMNQFCEMKGIKREFSVARTPQQNGVAERRNRTLIEAARTMLVDSKLPTTFWAEAVNTACYVLNRVLVIKPHNKTPYELIRGRTPLIDFMKPFGFNKAMRVFNKRTKIVEETLNIRFLENTHNLTGNRPDWLFDVDSLTISMNYVPVVAGKQINGIAGTRDNIVIVDESRALDKDGEDDQATRSEFERLLQQEKQIVHPNSTNSINTVSTPVSAAGPSFTNDDLSSLVNVAEASNAFEEHLFERFSPFKNAFTLPPVSNVTPMDDTRIFGNAYGDEDVGAEAD
ncbi:putative ribonuclease H-like domain-containing protein [Tanacetum coccineum]